MIPEGWREAKIRDVAKIAVGRDLVEDRFSRTKTDTHRHPIYSNTVEAEGLYGFYDFPEYSGESVTMVGRGIGLGTAFARRKPFGAIGRLLVLSAKSGSFDVGYLAEFFNHRFRLHYESGGIPQLPGKTLGNYPVLLPPLPEQVHISKVLQTWDCAIETVEALIAGARAQKQALMQQLLPQGATPPRKRLLGFSGEWQETTLADILSVKRAKGKIVPTNEDGIGVPYIGSTSFLGEFSNYTDASAALLCGTEDILVLWDGEYAGKVTTGLEGAVSSTVARYRLAKGDADPIFVVSVLENAAERIRSIREGSGIPHMPGDFEHWFKFALPCFGEQQAIAHAFKANRLVANQLEIQLAALRREKAALMQQLLTGKRRVAVAENADA